MFSRKRKYFYVVKLFKITNEQSAKSFPMKKALLENIEHLTNLTGLTPTHFTLNYSKDYRTFKGFQVALSKQTEIVYAFVGFDTDKTKCLLVAHNAMENYSGNKPENSSVDFYLQFGETYYNDEKVIGLCKELFENYQFEYGYIQRFPDNVYGGNERKFKGGLFSKSVTVSEIDLIWTFHAIALRYGNSKRLYNVNFLNRSHFENPELQPIISQFGTVRFITPDILMWLISTAEIETLDKLPAIKRRIVQLEKSDNEFLATEGAKEFNELMKIKTT
jgi:hypothetical protein